MRHVGFRTSTAAREVPAAGRGMTGGGFSLAEDIDGIVQRPCNGPRKARSMGATKDRCAAVILYVLATDAQAFADFEMTNQEFVDAGVIIVNDNRIEVWLADG